MQSKLLLVGNARDYVVCISRFPLALSLLLGLSLVPTVSSAEPAPAYTVVKKGHIKRHSAHTACRYTGQRCSIGCGTFPDKGLCAEYVCDHRSWNFSGFCLKSFCSPKSC
jgi:hypothetical protein